jgi:NTP pyrophosphatase (non-canonical NTP hydrolase)
MPKNNVEFSATFRTRVFITEVVSEIAEAREKFPKPDHLFPALIEEVGELAQALMEVQRGGIDKRTGKPFTNADVFNEAVQVAAMAARIAAEGDPLYPQYKFPFDDLNK